MIDAHVHIYDYITRNESIKFNKLPEITGSETSSSYTPDMLINDMKKGSVEKAVLLQGPYYGNQNEYVREAVQMFPDRFTGALYIDPWDSVSKEMIGSLLCEREFTAVKLECSVPTGLFGLHKHASLYDKQVLEICEKCEESGHVLIFDLGGAGTRSYQTSAVREIALRFNNLKIVICHLGQPGPGFESDKRLLNQWHEQINLGLLSNIWFDTAAIPAYFSHEAFPFQGAGRYFRKAVEMIGPEKIIWGTDIPGLLSQFDYKDLLGLADIYMTGMRQEEKEMIRELNAVKVYFED